MKTLSLEVQIANGHRYIFSSFLLEKEIKNSLYFTVKLFQSLLNTNTHFILSSIPPHNQENNIFTCDMISSCPLSPVVCKVSANGVFHKYKQ